VALSEKAGYAQDSREDFNPEDAENTEKRVNRKEKRNKRIEEARWNGR
jgi:hypothetical protein